MAFIFILLIMAASKRRLEDEEEKYTAAKSGNKLTIKKGKKNITTRTNKAGKKVRVVTRDTKDGGSKFVKKTVRGTTPSGGKVVRKDCFWYCNYSYQ